MTKLETMAANAVSYCLRDALLADLAEKVDMHRSFAAITKDRTAGRIAQRMALEIEQGALDIEEGAPLASLAAIFAVLDFAYRQGYCTRAEIHAAAKAS